MDKYFYLLVGLVWVISNLYKSFKKKEVAQPTLDDDVAKPPKRNIETILQELLIGNEEQPIPTKEQPTPYAQELAADSVKSTHEVTRNNTFTYEKTAKKTIDFEQIAPVVMMDVEEEEYPVFDLKAAIIYSEIIAQPKYLADS